MRHMQNKTLRFGLLALILLVTTPPTWARKRVYNLADYGIKANTETDAHLGSRLKQTLETIKRQTAPGDKVVLKLERGTYHFHADDAPAYEFYISNHDQDQPKRTAILLNGWQQLTLEGNGADLVFHGRLIPLVLSGNTDLTVRNLSIDFANPQIAQVQVVKNSREEGITFEVAPWVNYRIGANGRFETYGEGWTAQPAAGMAFERDTRHIVYNTADLGINTQGVQDLGGRQLLAPHWKDSRLVPGTVVTMRTWQRPCPGIFMRNSLRTTLHNVRVHYAEGMGLIAQRCTDITLNKFGVCLRGADDARYFTTQADATHFSQCRGKIISDYGLYEGMMDDAINIHGIYLKVRERIDSHTLRCRYEHGQTWGFDWGDVGDEVTFVKSQSMEYSAFRTHISRIEPADKPTFHGCRELIVTCSDELPAEINANEDWGIENLTWTPEVEFKGNIVRNNRARGALFSSSRRTVCKNNLFDHTSGTAILLCGDCNGWYESGAVRDLLIEGNTFVNALTSLYQFTNAVISIYPEIPQLKDTAHYFHGQGPRSIVIRRNNFDTFDAPLLYAKSVDGLVFKRNEVRKNSSYKPFHWNKQPVMLEHCTNTDIDAAD